MARLLQQFTESPRRDAYLPDRLASVEYKVMVGVSPEELKGLLEHGLRGFGPVYFPARGLAVRGVRLAGHPGRCLGPVAQPATRRAERRRVAHGDRPRAR